MKRAIAHVALWCLISFEAAFCASVKFTDQRIVKRDVDILPAMMGGAVDMTLDLFDRFGKGFAVRCNSKTDAFGLHDDRNFEMGQGDAMVPQEREKRSAAPCGKKNETSTVNRRNATGNPDVELLARRKRSAPPNGYGYPSNSTRPGNNAATQNKAQSSDQIEASNTPVRKSRSAHRPKINDQQQQDDSAQQRKTRDVNDPDKVVPTNANEDKNLFERIVQVTKELVARVTKWFDDMDKEQPMAVPKSTSEKPK